MKLDLFQLTDFAINVHFKAVVGERLLYVVFAEFMNLYILKKQITKNCVWDTSAPQDFASSFLTAWFYFYY